MSTSTEKHPVSDRLILLESNSEKPIDETSRVSQIHTDSSNTQGRQLSKYQLLVFFWFLALIASIVIATRYSSTSQQFFGITGSKEKSISFQYPVEIVNIAVVEGSKVNRGDLLLEVRRYDLASDLTIVDEKITELISNKKEITATTVSEVKSLDAQKLAAQAEIDIQIAKIQSQLKFNTQFNNRMSGPSKATSTSSENILVLKLHGLKKQRQHSTASFQAKIDNYEQQLRSRERPADAKLAVLIKRKQELQRQAESLKVNAYFSGSIGSVLFSHGEQVPKFDPILTLHGESPSFVKAYIHEAVINEVKLGQKVWVESKTTGSGGFSTSGRIESLGNRIVEYPERLKRNSLVSAWGREVIIELEEENNFLLGEKVVVFLEKQNSWIEALSNTEKLARIAKNVAQVFYTDSKSNESSIRAITAMGMNPGFDQTLEASGLTWDPGSHTYWMVCDENNVLFELNSKGGLLQVMKISGLLINDAESVSFANDSLYIAASVSVNKSGKLSTKRRKLVQLKRDKERWVHHRELDLYKALERLSQSKRIDTETRKFIEKALKEESMDIEAHQVRDNSLYLGFKSPLSNKNHSVILKIGDLESLFSSALTHAEIWKTFQLVEKSKKNVMILSDMFFFDDKIYLTGVDSLASNSNSGLWELDVNINQISHIQSFVDYKAEGVAINTTTNQAMLVFDGDNKKASHYTLKVIN